MLINPGRSQSIGVIVSIATAVLVGLGIYLGLSYMWDFLHVGEVLGTMLGIVIGGFAGFGMYFLRLRKVDLNWSGVRLWFGKPNGDIYNTGDQWVGPFDDMRLVPAASEIYRAAMLGEKIDAQDGAPIYFGLEENGGKRNELQYSIVDPVPYTGVDDPEQELRDSYLEEARFFFGQMAASVGVKNEKTLFSDYAMLQPGTPPDHPFRQRLIRATFVRRTDRPNAQPKQPERLFTDEAVDAIMEKAGTFLTKAASWGLGNIIVFTPNVRENPETEAAAAKKQAAVEEMEALGTKTTKITDLTKSMRADTGMSADLAGVLVASISGVKVELKNETYNYAGLPDVVRELGTKAIDALAKK